MQLESLEALEFDALRAHLSNHAQTPAGMALALELEPSTDLARMRTGLGSTSEAYRFIAERGRFGLGGLADLDSVRDSLRVAGTILEPRELLDVAAYIRASLRVRDAFDGASDDYPLLSAIVRDLPDLAKSLAEIEKRILPSGEIDENASPELRRIRREIQRLRSDVQRSLERLIRERAPDAMQDELITIRNGRFVVPVRAEFKGKVKGVLHGSSSTGQTLYMEPLETIDQNNELAALRDREEAEIIAILSALTDRIRAERDGLDRLIDGLARLDFAAARAHLAREFDCVEPEMREDGILELEGARHALLELNLRSLKRTVVPMSLALTPGSRVLVISGPNAGGKTVVLKTLGLCALMAQSGLHVPARRAALPIFDDVLVDIGDHQSLAANLSTFSAHVRNIASMIEDLPRRALVLLDEIGTGTDPDEGGAIAIAVLERLRSAGAYVVATTHYNRLKMYASNTEGVENAAVEFDEKTLEPTYRLLIGLAGSSSGIEIARRLGLQEDVIESSRHLMTETDLEAAEYLRRLKASADEVRELRAALDDERDAVAMRYANLELDFERKEKERSREFSRVLEETVKEFEAEARRLVSRTTDKGEQVKLRKAAEAGAARLRGEARTRVTALRPAPTLRAVANNDEPAIVAGPIEPSVEVFVRSLGQRGTVETVSGDRVEVRLGLMKLRVGIDDVERVAPSSESPVMRLPSGVDVRLVSDELVPSELNLIGRNSDDARDMLDKFLDSAFLGSLSEVRVVHGFGTGALKRAVAEVLSHHPHVARFGPAPSNQGGGGATVVELRQ